MDHLDPHDVPYGNDWDSADEAATWTDTADDLRPWRIQIRDHFANQLATLPAGSRVLELGSGPGLLAHRALQRCPHIGRYTLLDFSEPMLALSRERLRKFPNAAFVLASFKSEEWPRLVDPHVDCVVSVQAIHELRHKRHALRLYEQVYGVLRVPGRIMICDHLPLDDSSRSAALYMTEREHQDVLAEAGFANVRVELKIDRLVCYAGERTV